MNTYKKLTISDPRELVFGSAPYPLTTRQGMVIGGGVVYPELNFTLPPMEISGSTITEIRRQYKETVKQATKRAAELEPPGLVLEFETLPQMVESPEWVVDLCRDLLDCLEEANNKYGLKSVLRMTPNDTREMRRPPVMRSGKLLENMLGTFEGTAAAGAELLSIESLGGKEVCDNALLECDLDTVLFSMTILAVRDRQFLWGRLKDIADRHGVHCAGDTACGFGNQAMVLADMKYIPRVFAAVVRSIGAVPGLVPYENGAVGPGKDCGYENPFVKAITGLPMSMEGKTAACAHFSPLGNIAAATCDLWSNESVQNIRLLAGMAPVCQLEQLIYDCRLMNQAKAEGQEAALMLRDLFVASDASRDPQAYILSPENVIRISQAMVDASSYYGAGQAAASETVEILRIGLGEGMLRIEERELPWLDLMDETLSALPDDEGEFVNQMLSRVEKGRFIPSEYGL